MAGENKTGLFGEENCMEKVIIDTCGVQSWNTTFEHMTKTLDIQLQSYAENLMSAAVSAYISVDFQQEAFAEVPEEPPSSEDVRFVIGNCSFYDMALMSYVTAQLSNFSNKLLELEAVTVEAIEIVQKDCKPLLTIMESYVLCFQLGSLDSLKGRRSDFTRSVDRLCSSADFLATQFFNCQNKLDVVESDCFQNWKNSTFSHTHVLPNEEEKKPIDEGVEKTTAICKDYSETDNCLKKEIEETCGFENWINFREHMLGIYDEEKDCNFNEIL